MHIIGLALMFELVFFQIQIHNGTMPDGSPS
jgi:hypothetical protein